MSTYSHHVDLDRTYTVEGHYWRHVVRACSRLYAPEPLTPDDRRYMAQALGLVIENAVEFDTVELHDVIVAAQVEGNPI